MSAFQANVGQDEKTKSTKHLEAILNKKGERRMGKATGFMEYTREKPKERHPLKRLSDWKEYSLRLSLMTLLSRQGARCMDCATPFCHMGIEIQANNNGVSDTQLNPRME